MMKVPFADLQLQYQSIKTEVDEAIASVIRDSAFVRGPFVEAFEREFGEAHGGLECVSCANGTDSLFIAMRALGAGAGDEVICPAMSWISTSETISLAGAKVVFCDIDPQTYTLDVSKLSALVTPRTVGIIPVHLYGQPCDMDAIMAFADARGLWVLEDCAQAHFATYKGRRVGTFGHASSFSFYPGKNLGAMGDAGALLTNDAALARKMAMFARHGGVRKGEHEIEGINSRLDGLQAAILSVKLRRLEEWTAWRRSAAVAYRNHLRGNERVGFSRDVAGTEHVYHLFVVEVEERARVARELADRGVQTAVNYPVALPFLPAYSRFGHTPADFPVAHRLQTRCLSLPMFAEITSAQVEYVASVLRESV